MSLILGRDEKVVREDNDIVYVGGSIKYGNPMRGRLILTNKRFEFIEQRLVESGPFFKKTKSWQTVGIRFDVPIEKVVGAETETRTRKKGTLTDPPTMFSKESYNVLIVSAEEPEEGVDNPVFIVEDPSGWTAAIQRATGGETV